MDGVVDPGSFLEGSVDTTISTKRSRWMVTPILDVARRCCWLSLDEDISYSR